MNIYWSVVIPPEFGNHCIPFVNYREPTTALDIKLALREDANNPKFKGNLRYCPAFTRLLENTFALKFPFEANLDMSDPTGQIGVDRYGPDFWNNMLNVRSRGLNLYSVPLHYIFIAEDSLEMSVTGAHFTQNEFTNNTLVVPGQFDIGRWVRPLDLAFYLKDGAPGVHFEEGADYAYVKFHTEEPVTLKKFFPTPEFNRLVFDNIHSKSYKKNIIEKLSYFYDLYRESKVHSRFIKEIKANLLD